MSVQTRDGDVEPEAPQLPELPSVSEFNFDDFDDGAAERGTNTEINDDNEAGRRNVQENEAPSLPSFPGGEDDLSALADASRTEPPPLPSLPVTEIFDLFRGNGLEQKAEKIHRRGSSVTSAVAALHASVSDVESTGSGTPVDPGGGRSQVASPRSTNIRKSLMPGAAEAKMNLLRAVRFNLCFVLSIGHFCIDGAFHFPSPNQISSSHSNVSVDDRSIQLCDECWMISRARLIQHMLCSKCT